MQHSKAVFQTNVAVTVLVAMQDWLADGHCRAEASGNIKAHLFSMCKALKALHSRGIVHRSVHLLVQMLACYQSCKCVLSCTGAPSRQHHRCTGKRTGCTP